MTTEGVSARLVRLIPAGRLLPTRTSLEERGDGLLVVDVVNRLSEEMCHGQLDDLGVVGAVRAERDGV